MIRSLSPLVPYLPGEPPSFWAPGNANAYLTSPAASFISMGAMALNRLAALPFVAPRGGCTLDRIAIRANATVANAVCRIGIYTADPTTGAPASLVAGTDTGELAVATSVFRTATINVALASQGRYWLASLCGVAQPNLYYAPNTIQAGIADGAGNAGAGCYATQTYGALPATFPDATLGGYLPIVYVRRSA